MEKTELLPIAEVTTDCVCGDVEEDDDGTRLATGDCYGCWQDSVDNLQFYLTNWLETNGWYSDTPIRINGTGMGWQSRSGYADTTAGNILDKLTLNGDYTLTFFMTGDYKTLEVSRSSHDEPTGGARFTFEEAPSED